MNEIEQCIDRWTPAIKNLAKKYANTICSMEDLMSEGKLCIIRSWDKYDVERGSMDAFLKKCLKNAIQSAAAASSFAVSIPSGSLSSLKNPKKFKARHYPLEEIVDNRYGNQEVLIDLHDLIKRFDRDGIAWAHLVDNMRLSEIAEDTGFSLGTVSRVVRTVKKLVRNNYLTETR